MMCELIATTEKKIDEFIFINHKMNFIFLFYECF